MWDLVVPIFGPYGGSSGKHKMGVGRPTAVTSIQMMYILNKIITIPLQIKD
jgi:hypothetical protein